MLPLMLDLYVSRKEAGAPLHLRIEGEIANHFGCIEGALGMREFFVGDSLSGAGIQVGFVAEVARSFRKLDAYPNFATWLTVCTRGRRSFGR